jgi:hypothetical protein
MTRLSSVRLLLVWSADTSFEHRVIQNEGDDMSPPNTSCFLESEERSVSHSFIYATSCQSNTDTRKTFTVCVDMSQASIFRPQEELTVTIYVDGRRIAYLSPSRDSARHRIQQVSTMVSDDRGRKVEGRLIFTKLVSLTPPTPTPPTD